MNTPDTPSTPAWKVQLKGELRRGSRGYELSVVRESNKGGQSSWGWGNQDKIILFGTGVGANMLAPSNEKTQAFAMKVANFLCNVLNEHQL